LAKIKKFYNQRTAFYGWNYKRPKA